MGGGGFCMASTPNLSGDGRGRDSAKQIVDRVNRPLRRVGQRLCSRFRMESNAQRTNDFQNRREARISVLAERLVEAFTTEPRVSRNLGHSSCTSDVTERPSNASCVVRCLSQPRIQVGRHFLGSTKLLRDVIGGRLDLPGCCRFRRDLGHCTDPVSQDAMHTGIAMRLPVYPHLNSRASSPIAKAVDPIQILFRGLDTRSSLRPMGYSPSTAACRPRGVQRPS